MILVTYRFLGLTTFGKLHRFSIKLTCESDPSVVSFLSGLALMKTTVLKSMRTLSYFRLDTLPTGSFVHAICPARCRVGWEGGEAGLSAVTSTFSAGLGSISEIALSR